MTLEHKIIWNELHCPDVDAAIAFYGALFGWTIREEERATYLHFYADGQTVGGLMQAHDSAPPLWQVYVGTDDVEAYTKRAEAAGGRALTPLMDIPHTGKLQILLDPEGASLAPFAPLATERDSWNASSKPGHFCWVELLCDDLDAEVAFYEKVAGWQTLGMDVGGEPYQLFVPPGGGQQDAVGGAGAKPPWAEGPSAWLPYVSVADVDAATKLARELDAKVVHGPEDIGEFGRCSVLRDPSGCLFAVYQQKASC